MTGKKKKQKLHKPPSADVAPATVPRGEFTRILGNLARIDPEPRKDVRSEDSKKGIPLIAPTQKPER